MIVEKDWTTAAGLRAVVVIGEDRGRKTHRCGYVEVPADSPLAGKGYSDSIPQISQEQVDGTVLGKKSPLLLLTACVGADEEGLIRRSLDVLIDVHGGLTYAGSGEKYPVPDSGWWFGFDCSHCGDAEIERNPLWEYEHGDVVRELPYVMSECEYLAVQLNTIGAAA